MTLLFLHDIPNFNQIFNRILDDTSKFKRLHVEEKKVFNHIIHMKQCISDLLKSFKNQNEILVKNYNLYLSGSNPEIFYGLVKIRKALEGGIPTFRPIFFATGTTTYKLAKLLKPITTYDYATRYSFLFAKELEEFDPILFIATFYAKSLFTNIPLTETTGLCVENHYSNQTYIHRLSKSLFRRH